MSFLSGPQVSLKGAPEEQAQSYLEDPSHNVIELKAYRNVARVLGGQGSRANHAADVGRTE